MARFFRAMVAGLSVAALVACGGGGGGGGGGGLPLAAAPAVSSTQGSGDSPAAPTVPADPQAPVVPVIPAVPNTVTPFKAFVVIPNSRTIAAFSDANPAPGSTVQVRAIKPFGALGGLPGKHISYDAANDRLYASVGASIIVIDQASTASGDVTPARIITTPSVGLAAWTYLVFDKANDMLWLGGSLPVNGALLKIANASTAQGAVTPANVYPMAGPRAFAIDTQRALAYVLNSTIGVHVFDLATIQDTTTLPSNQFNQPIRNMNFPGANVGADIALDVARDRIYAVDAFNSLVVVDRASSASGVVPFAKLTISMPQSVSFDPANDRLYVGGGSNDALIFNQASGIVGGTAVPAASLLGPAVALGTFPIWGVAFP